MLIQEAGASEKQEDGQDNELQQGKKIRQVGGQVSSTAETTITNPFASMAAEAGSDVVAK